MNTVFSVPDLNGQNLYPFTDQNNTLWGRHIPVLAVSFHLGDTMRDQLGKCYSMLWAFRFFFLFFVFHHEINNFSVPSILFNSKFLTRTRNFQGPLQTPLHSCAEPNSVRFDLGATLERQLIQTAYLCRTYMKCNSRKQVVNNNNVD